MSYPAGLGPVSNPCAMMYSRPSPLKKLLGWPWLETSVRAARTNLCSGNGSLGRLSDSEASSVNETTDLDFVAHVTGDQLVGLACRPGDVVLGEVRADADPLVGPSGHAVNPSASVMPEGSAVSVCPTIGVPEMVGAPAAVARAISGSTGGCRRCDGGRVRLWAQAIGVPRPDGVGVFRLGLDCVVGVAPRWRCRCRRSGPPALSASPPRRTW